MNLGVMQLANLNVTPTKTMAAKPTSSSTTSVGEKGKFGEVFNKVMSSQNNAHSTNESTNKDAIDLQKLTEVLNADSMEEVLDLLGISHESGLLTIQVGDEGQALAVDEMMNLNDLLSILNLDLEQLTKMLEQMLNEDELVITDLWQLINLINEQAPELMSQISSALQGEHKVVTPKQAEQFMQLIKLSQLAGKNSDLLNDQEVQITNLKELLSSIATNVQEVSKQVTSQSSTSTNGSLQGFQQVVKQVETTTESTTNLNMQSQNTTSTTRTFTITLPAEKSAQGEAVVKEIQNLLGRSQLSNTQGTMKLLLKLYPENLGSIRIEVIQQDGVLSARLLASTPQAKELLDSQLNQLKTALANVNIQMDRIDIAQSLQETDRNLRDQSMFSNLFNGQSEQENEDDDQHEDDEEKVSFQEYLINEGV